MDSSKSVKILKNGLDKLLNDITENSKKNNRVASGKTVKSLRVVVEVKGGIIKGTLYGSSVLEQLEYGRVKTKNAGIVASWEKDLRDWMSIRGIPESAFFPIWRSIHDYGWNPQNPSKNSKPIPGRNKYGGTDGLVSDPLSRFKNTIGKELKLEIVNNFKRNGINNNG